MRRLSQEILDWYDANARVLPWRIGPADRARGRRPDPYSVWLSEIMLQQTTIAHATRYFLDFTERWPTVDALAAAPDAEVMAAWAGLGYYARARNLLKCARALSAAGGKFPDTEAELLKLPGIGPYTAGAIAAIAFDRRAAAVDGNVDRVAARLLALDGDWADQKAVIRQFVEAEVPDERPGEFAEAMMDLGATVCTPKRPDCPACPLKSRCKAHAEGMPETYPRKPKKAAQKVVQGWVLVVVRVLDEVVEVAVERRGERGLLGGMIGLPGTDWTVGKPEQRDLPEAASLSGHVEHVFTHLRLTLEVWRSEHADHAPESCHWMQVDAARAAMPSVFVKALDRAMGFEIRG